MSLLTRFGIVSFVLVAALGVVLGAFLQHSLRQRTLTDAIRTAEIAADVGITPLLRPEDLTRDFVPLDADRVAQLDAALAGRISDQGVVRIKIWNRHHWLVYSDNPRLVARWFPGTALLEDSFQGRTVSEVTDLTAPEELEEREFGELLAVYVPLRMGPDGAFTASGTGEVVGAFEIYLPYRPIADAIAHDTRNLYLAVGIGLLVLYLALFRLVAGASRTLRRQATENRHQALHDALTGLPNRVLFQDRVERALADARRHGTGVAVMLLDLDRFKEINDTLGHRQGDVILREIGPRLLTRLHDTDTVARLGGDEYALLLPGVEHAADAAAVAADLEAAIVQPFTVGGLELDVRASVGVALFPDHGDDPDTLLQRADVAMYVAKRSHSTCEVYNPALDHYSPERLELAADVRRAIDEGELLLHYQPKLDLRTDQVTGVEALVRWQHPVRGFVGPGEFMPVIENTELIAPLTLHILDMALAQCRAWLDEGIELTVAVNLSARNVNDQRLPGDVANLLGRHGLAPARLELELTESALLDNPARARAVLERLHDSGVLVTVDDFGTGYASLAYLTELPVGALKIDQAFVRTLEPGSQEAAIVQFSVELGRSLGLHVVAEGVEDEAVLQYLRDVGCDLAQGYHVSRPIPADALVRWLGERPSIAPEGAVP